VDLPGIGEEGQRLINAATVAIIGAGALGSAVATSLAAAGVGVLRVADFDTVDITNLQRQLAYDELSLGCYKVEALKARIAALNSGVTVDARRTLITRNNISDFISGADVVVEGSDNAVTKAMVTEAARALGLPCVVGGVRAFEGQVMTIARDTPVSYADVFGLADGGGICVGQDADGGSVLPCGGGGIFSPVPATVASLQSAEVLKIITGAGRTLDGRLLTIDTLTMTTAVYNLCNNINPL